METLDKAYHVSLPAQLPAPSLGTLLPRSVHRTLEAGASARHAADTFVLDLRKTVCGQTTGERVNSLLRSDLPSLVSAKSSFRKKCNEPGVLAQTFNPSTQEGEAR